MGRYLTDVLHTEFLAAPVPGRGKPGLFDVRVPEASLPGRKHSSLHRTREWSCSTRSTKAP